jgi:hypothetical protein
MKQFLLVLCLLVSLGCGTRSSLQDATVDNVTVDNDSGVVSSCLFNVTRHGDAWLLSEPEVHFVFWGDWNNFPEVVQPDGFQSTWSLLLGSDNVLQRLAEYGIHEGTLDQKYYSDTGPTVYVNDAGLDEAGTTLDGGVAQLMDNTFVETLNSEIQYGVLPYPNNNTLFVVMLPPYLSTHDIVANSWGGYHGHGSYGAQQYTFAIITYGGDVGTNMTISHEIYEAATNPGGFGWYDSKVNMEVADLCQTDGAESIGGFTVQKVWSQVLCQCQ